MSTRNLILSVATQDQTLPTATTVFAGYLFIITRTNPNPADPPEANERRAISPEPSVQFSALEVGSKWHAVVQAVQPDDTVFGPAVSTQVEITEVSVPPTGTYPAPTGLSFMLD